MTFVFFLGDTAAIFLHDGALNDRSSTSNLQFASSSFRDNITQDHHFVTVVGRVLVWVAGHVGFSDVAQLDVISVDLTRDSFFTSEEDLPQFVGLNTRHKQLRAVDFSPGHRHITRESSWFVKCTRVIAENLLPLLPSPAAIRKNRFQPRPN